MNDEKLIVNLDSIVKQLQKISATIGISVGVTSDKSGKPKIKSTLDANEKAREKNLFKEIELQYETMLGRVFSSTRNADAQANAFEFITAINKTEMTKIFFSNTKISVINFNCIKTYKSA